MEEKKLWLRVDMPHKAHLHWQKPKSKKPGFFVVPFTLPEKPIAFGVFGTKSACAKKPESHTCVLVSGAHAWLLSTFDRTRIVRITSRAAVGWFRWRSRTTWPKTQIIPARLEWAFTLAKNTVKFWRSFKTSRCGGGFFDSGFLECLGEVAKQLSTKNPNARKIRVFWCKCKRHYSYITWKK